MKVSFLIAEEIRPELNGKLSVLGLYAGNVILIGPMPDNAPPGVTPIVERLAIMAVVSDAPAGMHAFRGRILGPQGNLYRPDAAFGQAEIPNGFAHSVIIELKPFVINTLGTYQLQFFVDDQQFTFEFDVRLRE